MKDVRFGPIIRNLEKGLVDFIVELRELMSGVSDWVRHGKHSVFIYSLRCCIVPRVWISRFGFLWTLLRVAENT